jgi:prepilin-type N-terminal cleavage/methylation domain-containing protein
MNRSTNNSRGFTLIELLIVIGIVSLLAVALLPQIVGVMGAGKQAATISRIQMLRQMIAKYEQKHGRYPPSEFEMAVKGVHVKGDSVNAGIECLVIHLSQRSLGVNFSFDDKAEWLQNTDSDDNGAEVPELNTTKKLEVVDAWGTPFAYFHNASYGKSQRIMLADPEGIGGEMVTANAMKGSRGFLNGRKYQLISAGEDFEFGTLDDVAYPDKPSSDGDD